MSACQLFYRVRSSASPCQTMVKSGTSRRNLRPIRRPAFSAIGISNAYQLPSLAGLHLEKTRSILTTALKIRRSPRHRFCGHYTLCSVGCRIIKSAPPRKSASARVEPSASHGRPSSPARLYHTLDFPKEPHLPPRSFLARLPSASTAGLKPALRS